MSISLVLRKAAGQRPGRRRRPNPDNETYTVTFKPGAGRWTALGLEVVQDESLPGMRLARGADRLVVTEVEAEMSAGSCPSCWPRRRITGQPIRRSIRRWRPSTAIRRPAGALPLYGENGSAFLALRFANQAAHRRRIPSSRCACSTIRITAAPPSAGSGSALSAADIFLAGTEASAKLRKKGEAPIISGLPETVVEGLRTTEAERTDEQNEAIVDTSSGPRRNCSR